MKISKTSRTKAYLIRENAELAAYDIACDAPGWKVTVEESPDTPNAWGVRAERQLSDINENGVALPPDGLSPLDMLEMTPLPSPESTGRTQVVWLKTYGIRLPVGD